MPKIALSLAYLADFSVLLAAIIYHYHLDRFHYILIGQLLFTTAILSSHSAAQLESPFPISDKTDIVEHDENDGKDLQITTSAIGESDMVEREALLSNLSKAVPDMMTGFMALLQNDQNSNNDSKTDNDEEWQLMSQTNDRAPFTTVHKSPLSSHKYRIKCILDNSAETVFDFLTDIEGRPKWDELMEEARILSQIDDHTRVVYVKLKAIWPTSSRDMIMLTHIQRISLLNTHDSQNMEYAYVNVTKTISEFPGAPTTEEKGTIRMISPLAGQLIKPLNAGQCEILQLADGDPQGWIPASVIKIVMTQAIPRSMAKLNGLISVLPKKNSSAYFTGNAGISQVHRLPHSQHKQQQQGNIGDVQKQQLGLIEKPVKKVVAVKRIGYIQFLQKGMQNATPWMVAALLGITIVRQLSK